MFHYDTERELYICPQRYELPLKVMHKSEQVMLYIADAAIYNVCPVKTACTNSRSGRHIFHSFFQEHLDLAASYRETEAYKKALRKRQAWIETLFGEGKQWHGMTKFRLRGLEKVNNEEGDAWSSRTEP